MKFDNNAGTFGNGAYGDGLEPNGADAQNEKASCPDDQKESVLPSGPSDPVVI